MTQKKEEVIISCRRLIKAAFFVYVGVSPVIIKEPKFSGTNRIINSLNETEWCADK